MKENVKKSIMVLVMNNRVRMFAISYCFLIFTSEELVLAYLNKKSETEIFNRWHDDNKDSEYALSEADFRKFLYKYGQKYYEMSTENILKEDDRNFTIRNIDMIRMWFKACKRSYSFMAEEIGMLTIQTEYKKLKFKHYYRDWNRNIRDILLELYGSRVEYISGDLGLAPAFRDGKEGFY